LPPLYVLTLRLKMAKTTENTALTA